MPWRAYECGKLLLCFSEDEAIAAHEVAEGNLPEATDVHGRFQASEVASTWRATYGSGTGAAECGNRAAGKGGQGGGRGMRHLAVYAQDTLKVTVWKLANVYDVQSDTTP